MDMDWMGLALAQARRGAEEGEVPVGAVAVLDGRLLAAAHNSPISLRDPTAHAEILTLRAAAQVLGAYRISGVDLYVTLEPCMMCFGAMLHARIRRLVYAANDPKVGFSRRYADLRADASFNHTIEIQAGIGAEEAQMLLQEFFRARRSK